MAINSDKQVLYNIIEREISNIVSQFPILGIFGDTITNYILNYIDPYVNAFIEGPQQRLNIEQLSAFTQSEVTDKIARFKESYKKEAE
jgi:hypothetical protein